MIAKLITSQRSLLQLLGDDNLRLSVWQGRAKVVRNDISAEPVARVQNGLPTKMLDAGFLLYNGGYELTDKGKRKAAALQQAHVNGRQSLPLIASK